MDEIVDPDELVLVGGTVPLFLVTDPASPPHRATNDIDWVIDVRNRPALYRWEDRLRRAGFRNDKFIICRWNLSGIIVDFMPIDPELLGFANRWYGHAFRTATTTQLQNGLTIRTVTAPCFLATKLEAFDDRGRRDYIASKDLADVLTIVDGREELIDELRGAPADVREFVGQSLGKLLESEDFMESIPGHLLPDAGSQARRPLVVARLKAAAALAG